MDETMINTTESPSVETTSPIHPDRVNAASSSRDEARSGSASEGESRRAIDFSDRTGDRASPTFPGGPGADIGLGSMARQTGTRSGVILVGDGTEGERGRSGYLETTSG